MKQEYFGVINEEGEAMLEFNDAQLGAKAEDLDEPDDYLLQSQYVRKQSEMRQGEITLQKIRVNKKLRNKRDVAMDVLKMLNEIEGKGSGMARNAMA